MTKDEVSINKVLDQMNRLIIQMQPQAMEIVRIMDGTKVDGYLQEVLYSINDYQDLAQKLNFVISNKFNKDNAWRYIVDNKFNVLLQSITTRIMNYQTPQSPNAEIAKLIAQKIILQAKATNQNELLSFIHSGNYCFKNLKSTKGNQSATKYLKQLEKSDNQTDRDNAIRIRETYDKQLQGLS